MLKVRFESVKLGLMLGFQPLSLSLSSFRVRVRDRMRVRNRLGLGLGCWWRVLEKPCKEG